MTSQNCKEEGGKAVNQNRKLGFERSFADLGSNLVAALAGLKVNNLTHFEEDRYRLNRDVKV